ncbi:hypothetical protein GOODEAATRI_005735 [Goodea atripinnis]|uniref:Uncharacterized protein n=1 Tax=Goodea atripinnis TaxID=208336 RepID=A0ABV0PVM5_9TELE
MVWRRVVRVGLTVKSPPLPPRQSPDPAPSLPYRAQANRPMITECVNPCSPRSACPALLTAFPPPFSSLSSHFYDEVGDKGSFGFYCGYRCHNVPISPSNKIPSST